jgi:hypothetical protein
LPQRSFSLDWGNPDWSAADQFRRLRLFLAAYGPGPIESEVIETAIRRQDTPLRAIRREIEMTVDLAALHHLEAEEIIQGAHHDH